MWDDNSNRHYYWNPETNEVLWELPPGGVETSQAAGEAAGEEGKKDAMDEVEDLMENYPYLKKPIPEAKPGQLFL